MDLERIFSSGLMDSLGMGFYVDNDSIVCTMQVTDDVKQAFGALHGGASASLLETTASVNALKDAPAGKVPVGVSLSINHYRAVREGTVSCVVEEVFRGRSQVHYRGVITNSSGRMVADGYVSLVWKDATA